MRLMVVLTVFFAFAVALDARALIPIADDAQGRAAMAATGSVVLVAWRSDSGLQLARLNSSGNVIVSGPEIIDASPNTSPPAVAAVTNDLFVVVWREGIELRLVRFDASNGDRLDETPVVFAQEVGASGTPAIAGGVAGGALVAFADGNVAQPAMHVVMLAADGLPLTAPALIASDLYGTRSPAVAAGEGRYAVAWVDGPTDSAIGAGVLDAAGALVAEPVVVSTTTVFPEGPTVAPAAEGFVVAWSARNVVVSQQKDVFAAQIGADGVLVDDAAVPIGERFDDERAPSIASDGDRLLAVWTGDLGVLYGQRMLDDLTILNGLSSQTSMELGSGVDPVSIGVAPGAFVLCLRRTESSTNLDCGGFFFSDDADLDLDGDGFNGFTDNCIDVANADQADADADGAGDACDPCPADALDDADNDGVCGDVDNCPDEFNASQSDLDADGAGDVCDESAFYPDDAGVSDNDAGGDDDDDDDDDDDAPGDGDAGPVSPPVARSPSCGCSAADDRAWTPLDAAFAAMLFVCARMRRWRA
jgi:hypothetical protein